MKKILTYIYTIIILFNLLGFFYPKVITAQGQDLSYTVLAPLPGTTECEDNITNPDGSPNTNCKTTLEKYLPGLFKLLIALSAVWAVFMIVVGGFQYMTSDAITGKKEGLSKLQNSVLGLVLVICAWLLLNTINPRLLEFNLDIQAPDFSRFKDGGTLNVPPSTGTQTGTGGPQITGKEEDVREILRLSNITVNKAACVGAQTTNCTNIVGVKTSLIDGVRTLTQSNFCNCSIIITGGSEPGGHSGGSSHYTGNAIDLGFNNSLNSYIEKNGGTPQPTQWGNLYTVKIGNKTMTFLKESNHWHVEQK